MTSKQFVAIPAGTPVDLRSGRGPRVLITLHSAGCEGCRTYVADLAGDADRIADWGGRIVVAIPGDGADAAGLTALYGVQLLADPERRVASGEAAVFVSDEWGEVYHHAAAGPSHDLPDIDELEEWVRFIAIQCPECEGPEGEWRRYGAAQDTRRS